MHLAIRPAAIDDIDPLVTLNGEVQNLHAELFPEIFRNDWRRPDLETFWRSKVSADSGRIVVAEADGGVIGYMWMEFQQRPEDALHHARRRIYIHHICVGQAWRGKGVGRRLLVSADDFAREKDCPRVLLDVWHANTMATEVFERAGFVPLNMVMTRAISPL